MSFSTGVFYAVIVVIVLVIAYGQFEKHAPGQVNASTRSSARRWRRSDPGALYEADPGLSDLANGPRSG